MIHEHNHDFPPLSYELHALRNILACPVLPVELLPLIYKHSETTHPLCILKRKHGIALHCTALHHKKYMEWNAKHDRIWKIMRWDEMGSQLRCVNMDSEKVLKRGKWMRLWCFFFVRLLPWLDVNVGTGLDSTRLCLLTHYLCVHNIRIHES